MPKPIVTVILPAKDAGAFIGTTLATLARQFDEPSAVKLVAIDDGSTDDTGAHMRSFADRLEHVEVIGNREPVGLASARNQGLERVEGDFYCFIDGDDWMQPRRLQALVEAMKALGCDFVRTDHVTVTDDRRQLVRAPFAWRGTVSSPRAAILPASDTTMVDYPYAWAGMFHRRLIDEGLAPFPPGLFTAEDRPWIWRLHLEASSFAVVDAPAILYRRGVPSSLTQVLDRRQLDFIPAFALALEHVLNDRDAERFLPKILTTTLAVSAHHVRRSRSMSSETRRELRGGVRDLLRTVPEDALEAALRAVSDRKRRVLAPIVRESREGREGRAGLEGRAA